MSFAQSLKFPKNQEKTLNLSSRGGPKSIDIFFQSITINLPELESIRFASFNMQVS